MDSENRMNKVKDHFETDAAIFDQRVIKIIPDYIEMLNTLVSSMPFSPEAVIDVIDIGCGTGTLACAIKTKFKNSRITCFDQSQNMLDIARNKIKSEKDTNFIRDDIVSFEYDKKYDAIVSSLALHHLEGEAKSMFYNKTFDALKEGGIFINADIILSGNSYWQDQSLRKWSGYVLKSFSQDECGANFRRYLDEDRPAVLLEDIQLLKQCGFSQIDVMFRRYNFAVYGGLRAA